MFIKGCSLDCTVSILPNRLLGRLYYTFVLPILDYCDVAWSLSSVQFLEDLNVFILNCVHWFLPYQVFPAAPWLNVFILNCVHWFLPYKVFPAAPWLNVDVFMLLLLFTELFIGFHHCIWWILLDMLQLLPPHWKKQLNDSLRTWSLRGVEIV